MDWLGDLLMLSIGDFSKIAKVSIKTLRHYDQIGLLKPGSVDYYTGYRKYSILQLGKLNKILFYKDIGFSLKQIFDLIDKDLTIDQMKESLKLNKKRLESEIILAQKSLETIEHRIHQLEQQKNMPEYEIKVIEQQHYKIAYSKIVIPTLGEITFYSNKLYENLYLELEKVKIEYTGPEMNLYHNTEYVETDLEMEFAVGIKGTKEEIEKIAKSNLSFREIQDQNKTASLQFVGDYHDLDTPIIELLKWIEINHFEIDGQLREIHHSGKAHIKGELQKDAIVELQIPIREI